MKGIEWGKLGLALVVGVLEFISLMKDDKVSEEDVAERALKYLNASRDERNEAEKREDAVFEDVPS